MDRNDLANRMKEYYQQIPKTRLMRRTPVAIRIDGKAFHTFTRGFQKPFDEVLIKSMQETMKYLCENIQGCVLGYTQSDEITLILVDYKKLTSSAWFDYEVQKMCSIAASMATMAFNKAFLNTTDLVYLEEFYSLGLNNINNFKTQEEHNKAFDMLENKYNVYYNNVNKAMFDARCFNIPKEEVANLIYWRQLDASRNSIQMVGQANFSHKELQNKSCSDIQDMLMTQKGINWNDLPTYQKRGSCCIKREFWIDKNDGCEFSKEYSKALDKKFTVDENAVKKSEWIIDTEIPIFKGENREYIDRLIYVGE